MEVEPLWTPSAERVARSNLTAFRAWLAQRGTVLQDFADLYRWSIESPDEFWPAVWDFLQVRGEQGERAVVDLDRMPGARWFPDASLNFAENLLRYRDDRVALVAWNEAGRQRELTYAELTDRVAAVAAALRQQGVGVGDRVGAYLPNLPETVIAMLATTSLGAIWSSCSPDFGVKGAHDRLGQIEPKVLFTANGYLYAGKRVPLGDRVAELRAQLPSVKTTVVVPYLAELGVADIQDAIAWEDFRADGTEVTFERGPFDRAAYILYSSGTTGLPKCMMHGAGGTLLQHLKELALHTDLGREDRIFYYTTCGWMMWNWLVSSLAVGATVVLYDGSPFAPHNAVLWDMAAQERVTIFGTSAKYLGLAEKRGVKPAATHDLGALRAILSTGSPLLPEGFDYVYRDIKRDLCLSSIAGGTDLISCFALGNPTGPVYRSELQTRGLGMKVEVWNDELKPVVGEKGELVCTMPFPSMPVGFWNDPDGRRYRSAYFEHYPGVWRHGDWVELTERGGVIFYGRSDATLNPGGVRIGTSEIYRVVDQLPEVVESLVVGQKWEGDVRIVLFVKLAEGATLNRDLKDRIRRHVRAHASPYHVPRKILAVDDIPRTVSGKISELAVYKVIHGQDVDNKEALANPESLALFEDLSELRA